jgi:hypothetical protein
MQVSKVQKLIQILTDDSDKIVVVHGNGYTRKLLHNWAVHTPFGSKSAKCILVKDERAWKFRCYDCTKFCKGKEVGQVWCDECKSLTRFDWAERHDYVTEKGTMMYRSWSVKNCVLIGRDIIGNDGDHDLLVDSEIETRRVLEEKLSSGETHAILTGPLEDVIQPGVKLEMQLALLADLNGLAVLD